MLSIKFVFFGSDEVAKSALDAMARHGLVPSSEGEVAILVSYGKILSRETIDSFPKGILNIHPSLLPKLRGPSPIRSAILDNLEKTGVSIMKLDEKVDHGPILAQEEISLSPQGASEPELREALFEKGAELLARVLPLYLASTIKPVAQNHTEATYTKKFKSEDAFIPYPFSNASLAERKVRALNPEPGAFTYIPTKSGGKRLKIISGKIDIDNFVPILVQPDGKRAMAWTDFLRGNPITGVL